ncbi:MAG TPA: DUF2905 domain-containing protein [Chitinophagaceae bacterium]|nr:DUF2905 domain-containing protein [Chitinophagaceae bacterium]
MGKILIFIGALLLGIGLLLEFTSLNFSWFGNLPGDIRIEKPGFSFYMPITSMIILSIVLSGLFWLFKKIIF